MEKASFADIAVVACGTVSLELNHLKETGFLDTDHLFYTTPGLHQDIPELESQLIQKINMAKEKVDKVIVAFGGKFCYVNVNDPLRTMQKVIGEQGPGVARVRATRCMDMLAGEEERERIGRVETITPVHFLIIQYWFLTRVPNAVTWSCDDL